MLEWIFILSFSISFNVFAKMVVICSLVAELDEIDISLFNYILIN